MSPKIRFQSGPDAIEQHYQQLQEIFFEASSVKTFRDQEHRENFFQRWLGVYLENYPEQVILALDSNESKLLGYLCYHTQSPLPGDWAHPGTEAFVDLSQEFPVHFHINCHHTTRGQGIGQQLVGECLRRLEGGQYAGVHIITSPEQANVNFYLKLGFDQIVDREFKTMMLRWMGKKLK